MNPRDFCREPGYERAVFFTYDFDALFFERVILRDLLAGGSTDIQIVADAGRMAEVQERWIGQVRGIGRQYRLDFATLSGAFHPKLLLRTSHTGASVWVGSGNLTYGGWQNNLEVGTCWKIGPDSPDRGQWLQPILDELSRWIPLEQAGTPLAKMMQAPWFVGYKNDPAAPPPVLVSRENAPLGRQLRARWANRAFDSVAIATGSTDEGGALLDYFHSVFGIKEATILLNPESASFNPVKLGRLQIPVKLVKPLDGRRVHAKCYWFAGPQGSSAVIGSANCSTAAWLLPPEAGGNVETVVVYDDLADRAFQWFTERLSVENTLPVTLDTYVEPSVADMSAAPGYSVSEATWEQTVGELKITFTEYPPVDAAISLNLRGAEFPCQSTSVGNIWVAHPEPKLMKSTHSLNGTVTISAGSFACSLVFWVNDLSELRDFAEGTKFTQPVTGLRYAKTASEQQKIVSALQSLAVMILTNKDETATKAAKRLMQVDSERPAREPEVRAVDPEALIRSLDEAFTSRKDSKGAFSLSGVSLVGVMKVFFDWTATSTDLNPIEEPEKAPGNLAATKGPAKDQPTQPPPTPQRSSREKLSRQLVEFLAELRGSEFAQKATVEQLVQAAAYPLGVVVYGLDGGWIDNDQAQEIVRTVLDTLFWKSYPGAKGLLAVIRERYSTRSASDHFHQIVGDGTLWAIMLAALWRTPWSGLNAGIQKSLATRAILKSADLLANASVGRLSTLLLGLGPMFSAAAVLSGSLQADRTLTELEEYTAVGWESLLKEQRAAGPRIREGDVHYHPQAGWMFTIEQPATSLKSGFYVYRQNQAERITAVSHFYVNLSQAAQTDQRVAHWLRDAAFANGSPLK